MAGFFYWVEGGGGVGRGGRAGPLAGPRPAGGLGGPLGPEGGGGGGAVNDGLDVYPEAIILTLVIESLPLKFRMLAVAYIAELLFAF